MIAASTKQRCCFKDCKHEGFPAKGFDFYACPDCLDELERLCEQLYAEKMRNNS